MDTLVSHPLIPFISFTGSVANGKRVEKTAAAAADAGKGFKSVGLELGGKDAAYVREGMSCLSLNLFVLLFSTPRRAAIDVAGTTKLTLPSSLPFRAQTAIPPTPPRTLSTVPCSTRVSRAVPLSAFTSMNRSTTSLSRRL
jgi:hypothetical protein